ncbi:MAG: hypothetical protein RR825_05840 [Ruthenibacterium sp.]
MASARYTRNITQNAPEAPHVMTRKEKAENFWYYYKWHCLGGALALLLVGMFVHDMVTQVDADYQIAVLNTTPLQEESILALQENLTQFADDRNGDGKIIVEMQQYTLAAGAPATGTNSGVSAAADANATMDAYTQMTGATRLMADAQVGTSMLFLTDRLEAFQQSEGLFAYNDGTAPPQGAAVDYTRMGVKWTGCPKLTGLPLGEEKTFDGTVVGTVQERMTDYVLVKRIFDGSAIEKKEKLRSYYESSSALFDTLTAAA